MCDEQGWGQRILAEKRRNIGKFKQQNEAFVSVQTATSWKNVDNNCQHIIDIIEYCQQHGIRLIFVSTPCRKEYNLLLDVKQLKKMYELIHEFQLKYGIEYYDYRDDSRFCYDDFYDFSHLIDTGAEKFTKILADDIRLN